MHTYPAAGEYFVRLTVYNPNGPCDSLVQRVCLKCVFPGDANNDGIVNNKDVLYVGLAYGAIGPVRRNAATDSLVPSTPWVVSTGVASFQGGNNINHADCNGDGIINRHDLRIIDRNYGFRSPKSPGNECWDITDVPLYFEVSDSIAAGTVVNVNIMLGNSQHPAADVYGISYSILYSRELIKPGTVALDYSGSLFGTPSDIIYLSKDSNHTGKIESAISRIDHNNLTIAGRIGTAGFVMEENLAQKTMITDILNLSFADVTLIRSDETVIPVCAWQDSAVVYEKLVTSDIEPRKAKRISVYPNPAGNHLNLELPDVKEYVFEVADIIGKRAVYGAANRGKVTLDVSHLCRGLYFLTVRDDETVQSFKVEISR